MAGLSVVVRSFLHMNIDATEDIPRAANRGEGTGRVLGEAREAQNLSVAEVARQLKLSVHQVEALEAGEFHRLPGPVFVRGFVRNYARLLKLDAETLSRAVAEALPRKEPRPAAPPSQEIPFPTGAPRRWRAYAALAAAVVALLAAYEFFLNEPQPAATPARPAAAPAAPVAQQTQTAPPQAAQPDAAPAMTSGPAPQRAEPAGATVADAPQAAPPVAAGAAEAPPAPASSASREEEAQAGPGERQVRMVFDQESWVEIRDRSGRSIFSQLNHAGTEQRVRGRPPLSIVVGNARGVRLTYDERPVNLMPHTKVDVARLTLE